MEISKGIEIVDLCLYLKKDNALIISDTHIGYEEALNEQGILIPRLHFEDMAERLEKTFKKTGKLRKIIINGDIKHEFGHISAQEWRNALRLIDLLGRNSGEIILVRGNHDTILGPIAKKRDVMVRDSYKIRDMLMVHGHKLPKKEELKGVKAIMIGHEHPAVTVHEGVREEKFKCFLKGRWKGKTLIVQPSFNLVSEGTDMIKDELLSPFLQQDLSGFECFIVGDKVYDFGKLRALKRGYR